MPSLRYNLRMGNGYFGLTRIHFGTSLVHDAHQDVLA